MFVRERVREWKSEWEREREWESERVREIVIESEREKAWEKARERDTHTVSEKELERKLKYFYNQCFQQIWINLIKNEIQVRVFKDKKLISKLLNSVL